MNELIKIELPAWVAWGLFTYFTIAIVFDIVKLYLTKKTYDLDIEIRDMKNK